MSTSPVKVAAAAAALVAVAVAAVPAAETIRRLSRFSLHLHFLSYKYTHTP